MKLSSTLSGTLIIKQVNYTNTHNYLQTQRIKTIKEVNKYFTLLLLTQTKGIQFFFFYTFQQSQNVVETIK